MKLLISVVLWLILNPAISKAQNGFIGMMNQTPAYIVKTYIGENEITKNDSGYLDFKQLDRATCSCHFDSTGLCDRVFAFSTDFDDGLLIRSMVTNKCTLFEEKPDRHTCYKCGDIYLYDFLSGTNPDGFMVLLLRTPPE